MGCGEFYPGRQRPLLRAVLQQKAEDDVANPNLRTVKESGLSLNLTPIDQGPVATVQILHEIMPVGIGDRRVSPADRIVIEHDFAVRMATDGDHPLPQLGSLARCRVVISQQIRHGNRFLRGMLDVYKQKISGFKRPSTETRSPDLLVEFSFISQLNRLFRFTVGPWLQPPR
jgi:hypothetical protein